MNYPADVAVLIGRWQIFHVGHQLLLKAALATGRRVVMVIGSAHKARDVRNPFKWEERRDMIASTMTPEELDRVHFAPVRDYYDNERWRRAVCRAVERVASPTDKVGLVGFKKDETSWYLNFFPFWKYHGVEPEQPDLNATALRRTYFMSEDMPSALTVVKRYLPPAVLSYLQAWHHLPAYRALAVDHHCIDKYRKDYPGPYYLTVDAIVKCQNRVLLIKRGGKLSHGQWALPGGFLEPHETLYNGAIRELAEETSLRLLPSTMKEALRGTAVFDHPARSPRGRLITHTFFFDLGNIPCPEVQAKDDALKGSAQWVAIEDLPALEGELFEDHASVLDHWVGLYPEDA